MINFSKLLPLLIIASTAASIVPDDANVLKGYIDPADGKLVLPDNEQGRALPTAASFRGVSFVFPVAGRTFHSIEYTEETGLTDYRNRWRRNHYGTDIYAAKGTPMLAAADGVITIATFTPYPGPGWKIAIAHKNGVYSYYLHMDAINVSAGEKVIAGQKIGEIGASGNAAGTPTHVHFEMNYGVEMQDKPDWLVDYIDDRPGVASLRSVEPIAYLCKHDTLLRDFRGIDNSF